MRCSCCLFRAFLYNSLHVPLHPASGDFLPKKQTLLLPLFPCPKHFSLSQLNADSIRNLFGVQPLANSLFAWSTKSVPDSGIPGTGLVCQKDFFKREKRSRWTARHRMQPTSTPCLACLLKRLSCRPAGTQQDLKANLCTAPASFKFQGRGWGRWPRVGGLLCSRRMPSGQGHAGAKQGGPVFMKRGRKFRMEAA